MIRHHAAELSLRLDQVCDNGYCVIHSRELKRWYDQQRVTISIWRDIHDRWIEILDEPSREIETLFVAEEGNRYVFIWGEGLRGSKNSWYKDVAFLAGRAEADGTPIEAGS